MAFQVQDNKIDDKVEQFQVFLRDVFGIKIGKESVIKLLIQFHQEKRNNNEKYIKDD